MDSAIDSALRYNRPVGADDAAYVDRFCSAVHSRAMRTIGAAACD
jgi:hypothetical protein